MIDASKCKSCKYATPEFDGEETLHWCELLCYPDVDIANNPRFHESECEYEEKQP